MHRTGNKQFHHPAVGTLDLVNHPETLPTEGPEDLHMTACTAEPGAPCEDVLSYWPSPVRGGIRH